MCLLCCTQLAVQGRRARAQDDDEAGAARAGEASAVSAPKAGASESEESVSSGAAARDNAALLPAADGSGAGAAQAEAKPPRLLRSSPPIYPPERAQEGLHPTVVVEITLDAGGRVTDARIEESAGSDFDKNALKAVRTWDFAPAERNGKPVASRVHAAVHFDLPTYDLAPPLPGVTPGHPHRPVQHAGGGRFGAKATVDAEALREQERAASDVSITRAILAAAPRSEGTELLRSVPGVFVGRALGAAVGPRIMLRGFDAEHGQDLELKLAGMPLNLPAHIHGQGYVDVGFLIPEVVEALRAKEGVYDPAQGDFAVAGSIDIDLGWLPPEGAQSGWLLKTQYGSFRALRQLAVWGPREGDDETFAALEYRRSDGFGQRRRSEGVNLLTQTRLGDSTGTCAGPCRRAWDFRLTTLLRAVRADHAGVLRRDDLEADAVGLYDAYPFATAQSQNAANTRLLLGFDAVRRGKDGRNASAGVWLGYDQFRLQANFTGFMERSQTLAGVAGRGDLIEQRNRTLSAGTHARYRSQTYRPARWAQGHLELGLSGRVDSIEQEQNFIDALRNQTWDRRVDATIGAADLGFWCDLGWDLTQYLTLRFGIRADYLLYEIDDRLGNRVPLTRPDDTFIEGFRRSASGLAWGPRTSAEVHATDRLTLTAAYGEGYRSPQARTLEDGERAAFTKVRSVDMGMRLSWDRWLKLQVTGFWTHLSDDVAFEAREGRLERVGASRRLGASMFAETRPWPWLVGAASLTYVDAELLEPPPPTAEDPSPGLVFEKGQNLPFVPPLVLRLDVGAEGVLRRDLTSTVWGRPGNLRGRVGTGLSYISSRPLPYGTFASPFGLWDAVASLGWGPFGLGLEVFNLLDKRYAAMEFNYVSQWDPSSPPSRLPERHLAAGAPRTVMATFEVAL